MKEYRGREGEGRGRERSGVVQMWKSGAVKELAWLSEGPPCTPQPCVDRLQGICPEQQLPLLKNQQVRLRGSL